MLMKFRLKEEERKRLNSSGNNKNVLNKKESIRRKFNKKILDKNKSDLSKNKKELNKKT